MRPFIVSTVLLRFVIAQRGEVLAKTQRRRDAKDFLGGLCGIARDMFEIWLISKDVGHARITRSLSDLGNRSEHGGRARTNVHDFEAHSGPTQRKIRDIWAALPPAQ